MRITKEQLINHYQTWADTTRNNLHKRYALGQIDKIFNDEPLWVDIPRGSTIYHPETHTYFENVREAAEHFKCSIYSIYNYPNKYGIIIQK